MPRKRKPAPALADPGRPGLSIEAPPPPQAAVAAPGQPYGDAGGQLAAQAQMPLPDNQAWMDQALSAAQADVAPPVGLGAPSERPGEPVTAGLPLGPGPGPEVLGGRRATPTADSLMRIAEATGNDSIRQLAERARLQGV